MTDKPTDESERLIRELDRRLDELEARAEALLAEVRAAREEARAGRFAPARRKVIERFVKDRTPRTWH